MYQTQPLSGQYFKMFTGIYNDFCQKAREDYKFEIDPLNYTDFINCFEKGLLECILFLEDGIPTGFLAYSTKPKEVIELYVIHFLGNEDLNKKCRIIAKAFMQAVSIERSRKIIEFPMLGVQKEFKSEFEHLNFNFVDLAVMVFDINSEETVKEMENAEVERLPIGYKIVPYSEIYYKDLANLINLTFKDACDVKFDPRFATFEGSLDVADKITSSFYGAFIQNASKILLFEDKPVGFCLSNITVGAIGNIPLVGILREHRGQKLSENLLKATLTELVRQKNCGNLNLTEVNASVNIKNLGAFRMYKKLWFKQSYVYPQAFLPKSYV